MNKTTSPETQGQGRRTASGRPDDSVDRRLERRAVLRARHAQGVTRLMEERRDLRGVLPLADLVDDAIRWTA